MSKRTNDLGSQPVSSAPNHKDQVEQYLQLIGKRVLGARQAQRMSRRVLSEQAGVSQRTIVMLETGSGNISIALLFRIVQALGHSIEWLFSEDSRTRQDAERVADYFRIATPQEQQRVLNLLASNESYTHKQQRVCLIGLRGAGKSTLGAQLGQALSFPFIELNSEVEALSGLSVQEVMNLYGQEGYRRLELQSLEKLVVANDNLILAAAGGVVQEPDTHAFLLKHFHTVWLKAAPEEHMNRVKQQGDHRPMAGNPEAMAELKSILTTRESLYALADATVDTSSRTIDATLDELEQTVKQLCF